MKKFMIFLLSFSFATIGKKDTERGLTGNGIRFIYSWICHEQEAEKPSACDFSP